MRSTQLRSRRLLSEDVLQVINHNVPISIGEISFLTQAAHGGDGVRFAAVVQSAQDEGRGAVLLPDGIRGALVRIL